MKWLSLAVSTAILGCSGGDFHVGASNGQTDSAVGDSATSTDSSSDAGRDGATSEVVPDDATAADGISGDGVSSGTCVDSITCPTTHFCSKACGSATGSCIPRPPSSTLYDPVCGCDGITYWNPAIAVAKGASTNHAGPCGPDEAMKCGTGVSCDSGARCVLIVTTDGDCSSSSKTGRCWRIPSSPTCPGSAGSTPGARACGGGGCDTLCNAVKSGETLYDFGCSP